MQMDDMILVSIDDHMIEPPDMYENHVPAKWQDQVPKVVRNDERRRRVGVPGRERPPRRSAWPPPSAGPRRSGASTPARTPSCGPGCFDVHERVRDMNANGVLGVDELPDDGRLQRPHLHRGRRQGARARHAPGLQRLGHRRVVRRVPGPVHPARHRPDVGRRPRRRGGAPHRQEGLPRRSASSRRRTSQGFPSFLSGHWDPMLAGARATRTWCCRCTSAPASSVIKRAAGGADRPPHGARLPDQRASPPRTCCSARRCASSPTCKVALSEGGIGWIPFYFDRDRPPLPEPGVAARRRRLRRQAAVRGVPRAHPRLLHHRPVRACCCATASASTSSPGSATTRTPTRRGPSRRSSPGRSSRTPAARDEEIHKITWENACRFFDWDPFAHTAEGAGDGRRAAGPGHRRRHHPHAARRSGRSATRPPASASSERSAGLAAPHQARQSAHDAPADPRNVGDTEHSGRRRFRCTDNLKQHSAIRSCTVIAVAGLPARLAKELRDSHGVQPGLASPIRVRTAFGRPCELRGIRRRAGDSPRRAAA